VNEKGASAHANHVSESWRAATNALGKWALVPLLPTAHCRDHEVLHSDPPIDALVIARWCRFIDTERAQALAWRQPSAQPLAEVVLLQLDPAVGARQTRRDPFAGLAVGSS